MTQILSTKTYAYRRYVEGRLMGLRTNRYSWWVHWKELADYFLPRRYKWLITPNQMSRGSPINQYILDSTGCVYARNLASGLVSVLFFFDACGYHIKPLFVECKV